MENVCNISTDASIVKYNDSNVEEQLNKIIQDSYPIVEATGTNAYTGASARIKSVGKGTRCTLFVGTASTGNCSLNLNGSGAVAIKDSNENVVTNLKANIPYNLCHNGSDFILQGKGGGGNLIAKYLLSGYYGEGDNGRVDGAMVNRGAPTANLNCGGTYNFQEGYYSGGKVTANSLASQTQANADASKILQGYSAWVNGNKITGTATIQSLGGKNYKEGTTGSISNTTPVTINLSFVPKVIEAIRYSITGSFSGRYFVDYEKSTYLKDDGTSTNETTVINNSIVVSGTSVTFKRYNVSAGDIYYEYKIWG